MTPADVDAICGLVIDLCGVYLDESKAYLIESRLSEISKRAGCSSYAELAKKARYSADRNLQNQIVDAITTHETLFFRDSSPFEAIKNKVVPDLLDLRAKSLNPRRLRIWSAACSTGQEPYSIGIALSELLPDLHRWDIRIFATDVSNDAVAKASQGLYAPHEIERGMTPQRLKQFFTQEEKGWRIRPEIRSLVTFQRLNLLEPFRAIGPFDIIFCRNVAIYFTPDARRDLFNRLAQLLPPEGYLFVGSQESLTDLGSRFQPQLHCRSAFYRPNLHLAPAPAVPISTPVPVKTFVTGKA